MVYTITSKQLVNNENALYYFKRKYTVNEIGKSVIKIFADSRYKLYINSVLVAVGPCKASSHIKYYDEIDITKYIRTGENIFEVSVLQLSNDYSSNEYMFMESVKRSGGMCLGICGNAGDAEIITDESWLVAKENGIEFFYEPEYAAYNVAALCEKVSIGYRKNKYENAIRSISLYDIGNKNQYSTEIANPVNKSPIPMMFFGETEVVPLKNSIFDVGKLICGYIRLKCNGVGKIRLTYAECKVFKENDCIIKRQRDAENGVIIGDYDVVEVNGECLFEPYWMRTFRYIKADIEGEITLENLEYFKTGYPLKVSDKYDFGNDTDNKLFDISVNTLRCCMHETYMDCPYYEQLQYTMDTHLQIMYTYQLTDDKRLAEKAIDDFAKSYTVGELTQSRYPVNKAQYIPGFSIFFILMLCEHFKRFNDKNFITSYLPVADGIVDWFKKRFDGYMVSKSNLWDFVDWTAEHDKETGMIQSEGPITVYSLMLAYSLDELCDMLKAFSKNTLEYSILSDNIKNDVRKRCYDSETGLYADTPLKTHFAQHPQIWAVLCGMETGDCAKELLIKSMELNCKASIAYMFFLFRAFEKADIYDMSQQYIEILRTFVKLGCTTTPERLGDDVRSECHAWSAVAIYEFTAKILGVTYVNNTLFIKPYIVGRNHAKGEVAIPNGKVYIDWNIIDDKFSVTVNVPEGTKTVLIMPDNTEINANSGEYTCKVFS